MAPNLIRRLNKLHSRKLPPDILLRPEQATELARLSADMGRQLGLLLTRKGTVAQVVVGGVSALPQPDLTRLRGQGSRLASFTLLHTSFGQGLSQRDLNSLAFNRWDLLAVLPTSKDGEPSLLHVAHILPQPVDGQDMARIPPFPPGHPPEDLGRLVRSLEEELGRQVSLQKVAATSTALLVSVTYGPLQQAEENLNELDALASSAGLTVAGRVIQRRRNPHPRTLLGPGKLSEVLLTALRHGAGVLVFDQNLSPSQATALAQATDSQLKFIDRTQLILDIFAQRATTREGKLQVEMAQLRYLSPRLGSRDDGLSRLTGGIGGRGPGETKLEIDRRRVRQRLHRLKADLKSVSAQRQRRRQRRHRAGLPVLSIVGYTNAGKSTLLNALTQSRVATENRLFATLDPTTRRLRFPKEREVIITDTVGFIRDLPPELRRAFAATLEELQAADLLLHVADASHPRVDDQIKAVDSILEELDLSHTRRLLVLNKSDLADPGTLAALKQRYQAPAICARDRHSLMPLMDRIEQLIF